MTSGFSTSVPVEQVLLLASVLFTLGIVGLLVRRNVLFMLISVEVMLNAAGLAFVAAGAAWGQADGQVMFIFIVAMAAAEVSVGLALVLELHRNLHTLDVDAATALGESQLETSRPKEQELATASLRPLTER